MRGFYSLYRKLPRVAFTLCRITNTNYEREMDLLDVLCDPHKTGIDIGAKVGMYTYRIREHCSDVIAFEPIPLFHDMLRKVFAGKRGRVEAVALSNQQGTAQLRLPFDRKKRMEFGRSTIDTANKLEHADVHSVEHIEVPTRCLDDYKLEGVGFIKIDVEGHELAVLEGAQHTIDAQHPVLLVECNDDHQPQGVARLASWLAAHGYDAVFIDGQSLLPIENYDRAKHWDGRCIENFICIHRSRADVMERLAARVATRRLGSHKADRTA